MKNGDWKDYAKAFWRSTIELRKFRKENPELVEYLTEKYKNRKEKCPDCGSIMTDLGLDFKAPKKDKVNEWKIIQGLYKTGKVFHTCGCNRIGYIPKNERDYRDYLLERKLFYQTRLKSRDATMQNENLEEYISRFNDLIQKIDNELEKIVE